MWIVNFLPDWVFHLITLAGLVLFVVSVVLAYIPLIDRYKIPLQVLGIFIVSVGLFFEGTLYSNVQWNAKVAELELKVAAAEAASAKANTKIVTKYITRVEQIKDNTDETIKYIEQHVARDDDKCDIPNSVIVLHNSASKNEVPPSTGGAYEGTSDVKISEFTTTVVENYGTYYQISEQLKAWQEWYKTQKDIFEKAFN